MSSSEAASTSRLARIAAAMLFVLGAWSALSVTASASTAPSSVSAANVGHFLCYSAAPSTGSFLHTPSQAKLIDRWHTAAYVVKVRPSTTLCNPATKYLHALSFTSPNPNAHLVCNAIQPNATSPTRYTAVSNQFGTGALLIQATTLFCVPSKVAPDAQAAACKLDAQSVSTAVFSWDAQNAPKMIVAETGITIGTPSTYKSGVQAKRLISGRMIASWPGYSHGYAIALATKANIMAGAHAGDVMIYVPSTSVHAVDWRTQKSATGCNAL